MISDAELQRLEEHLERVDAFGRQSHVDGYKSGIDPTGSFLTRLINAAPALIEEVKIARKLYAAAKEFKNSGEERKAFAAFRCLCISCDEYTAALKEYDAVRWKGEG